MPTGYLLPEVAAAKFDPASVAYRAISAHVELKESITHRHHQWNRELMTARLKNTVPDVPDVAEQQSATAADDKRVAALDELVTTLDLQHRAQEGDLRPFAKPTDPVERDNEQELRQLLRSMNPADRAKALTRPAYARAALNGEAELSGLDPSTHATMGRSWLELTNPGSLRELATQREAVDAAKISLAAARAAVTAAKARLGTQPKPTATPERRWK
jgi:hypothetical protein